MAEEIRSIRGVEICAEAFGTPSDRCVLLIMGAMASMLWWDAAFCRALAERGLFVVRFDNRDVGRSRCSPPGQLDYSIDDMVADAIGLVESYGVQRAHLVGMSLGGMLAQVASLRFPERVASITAIASGPWADRPDLPGMDASITDSHVKSTNLDWTDETSVLDYSVESWKLLAGTRHAFDAAAARSLAQAEFRRARSLRSMFNHAQLAGAEDLSGHLNEIAVPVLVVHGTNDPVLPYAHGEAIAQSVPNARLVTLKDAGHELHSADWPLVIDAIVQHIERAEPS